MVDDDDWGKSRLVHQSVLRELYHQGHLVANWEDLGDGNDGFCLRNIYFIFEEFFYMP
jgi:hypothetical protein